MTHILIVGMWAQFPHAMQKYIYIYCISPSNLNSKVLYRNMPVSTWDWTEPPQVNIPMKCKTPSQDERLKPLRSNCVSFCITVSHTTAGGGELWSLCRSQGVCSCECKIRILTEPHTRTHTHTHTHTHVRQYWTKCEHVIKILPQTLITAVSARYSGLNDCAPVEINGSRVYMCIFRTVSVWMTERERDLCVCVCICVGRPHSTHKEDQ